MDAAAGAADVTDSREHLRALVDEIGEGLAAAGLHLAVAESCTGGLLAARLTDRPGASRFLIAGLVVYSDAAKRDLLDVDHAVIATHGAVSEPVARAMLDGVRRATGAAAAVAITGVAGPGGGTPDKPVGTVWIGAAVGDAADIRRFRFDGDRRAIREASVLSALELLGGLLPKRQAGAASALHEQRAGGHRNGSSDDGEQ